MRFSARVMKWLSPKTDAERMQCRRVAAEAEARAHELDRTVNMHHETLVEQLRRAFRNQRGTG